MGLVTPDYGTVFWMVLAFSLVLYILARFAWKPIMKSLKQREESIDEALKAADLAREEMARLKADHEVIMQEARSERDQLIAEARQIREKMIDQAREEASKEARKVMESARNQLANEKLMAVSEIKKQVAELSVSIAEKLIRHELSKSDQQERLIQDMLNDLNLN